MIQVLWVMDQGGDQLDIQIKGYKTEFDEKSEKKGQSPLSERIIVFYEEGC